MRQSQPRHRHCAPCQDCPHAPALGGSAQLCSAQGLEGLWVPARVTLLLSSELGISFPLEAAAVLILGKAVLELMLVGQQQLLCVLWAVES